MDKSKSYSSHLPVLKAICEVIHPNSAIECGMGNFSTKLLYENVPNLISVEHNKNWYDNILKEIKPREGFKPILWTVNFGQKTPYNKIEKSEKENLYKSYKSIAQSVDLLFVDTYTGIRLIALESLYQLAKIVVFHDSDVKGYEYDKFREKVKDRYTLVVGDKTPYTEVIFKNSEDRKLISDHLSVN